MAMRQWQRWKTLLGVLLLWLAASGTGWAEPWEVSDGQREEKILARFFVIVESDPMNDYAFKQVVQRAKLQGTFTAHVESYRSRQAKSPDDARLALVTARMVAASGDWAGAVHLYSEVLRLRPDDHAVLRLLAQTQHDAGQAEAALATYARAIELAEVGQERREMQRERAALLRNLGRSDEALTATLEMVADAPRDRYLRWEVAALLEDAGRYEAALEQYRAAGRLADKNIPERYRAELSVAQTLVRLQRYDEAYAAFEALMANTKAGHWLFAAARDGLVDAHRRAGQVELLLQRLDGVLSKSPKAKWAQWERACALDDLGRVVEAGDAYAYYFKAYDGEDLGQRQRYLAWLLTQGDSARFAELSQRWVENAEDEATRWVILSGWVRERARGALPPFEAYAIVRAYEDAFRSPVLLASLAQLYLELGESGDTRQRAALLLERALAIEPQRESLYVALLDVLLPNEEALLARLEAWRQGPSLTREVLLALTRRLVEARRLELAQRLLQDSTVLSLQEMEVRLLMAQGDGALGVDERLQTWTQLMLATDDAEILREVCRPFMRTVLATGLAADLLTWVADEMAWSPEPARYLRLEMLLRLVVGEVEVAVALAEHLTDVTFPLALDESVLDVLSAVDPQVALRWASFLRSRRQHAATHYELRAIGAALLVLEQGAGWRGEFGPVDQLAAEILVRRLNAVLEASGEGVASWLSGADYFRRLRRFSSARRAYRVALGLAPTMVEARLSLADLLLTEARRSDTPGLAEDAFTLATEAYEVLWEGILLAPDALILRDLLEVLFVASREARRDVMSELSVLLVSAPTPLRRDLEAALLFFTRPMPTLAGP